MPRNTIQFQKGLGLHDFLEQYGTEDQCRQALYDLRWPTGYVCLSAATQQAVNSKSVRYINVTSAIIRLP